MTEQGAFRGGCVQRMEADHLPEPDQAGGKVAVCPAFRGRQLGRDGRRSEHTSCLCPTWGCHSQLAPCRLVRASGSPSPMLSTSQSKGKILCTKFPLYQRALDLYMDVGAHICSCMFMCVYACSPPSPSETLVTSCWSYPARKECLRWDLGFLLGPSLMNRNR